MRLERVKDKIYVNIDDVYKVMEEKINEIIELIKDNKFLVETVLNLLKLETYAKCLFDDKVDKIIKEEDIEVIE